MSNYSAALTVSKKDSIVINVEDDECSPPQDITDNSTNFSKNEPSFLPKMSENPKTLVNVLDSVDVFKKTNNVLAQEEDEVAIEMMVIDEDAQIVELESEENQIGSDEYDLSNKEIPLEPGAPVESDNVFDSQGDRFLSEISESVLCENTEERATSTSPSANVTVSIRNEEALKWRNKMAVKEEEQREVFKRLRRFHPKERLFPDVRHSNYHTVTFLLTKDYQSGDTLSPYPSNFVSRWSPEFVPMPCCDENKRLVKLRTTDDNEHQDQGKKYVFVWARLKSYLENTQLNSCEDIFNVMQYCISDPRGPLNVLQYVVDEMLTEEEKKHFFSKVLPFISNMCLSLPIHLTSPLPFLVRHRNHSITLTQIQIACLLANAFFSTFPRRGKNEHSYSSINFNELFKCSSNDERFLPRANKVRCILHYFERIEKKLPSGIVTFTRRTLQQTRLPEWKISTKRLSRMVVLSKGTIETDGSGTLQVDFANRYLGGGVLNSGAVQEEILFVIYPELLASRLFTENLSATEALVVTGCERFSEYKGYASTFEYGGDFVDSTPSDSSGRKYTQIVAIDALQIHKSDEQFHPKYVLRELNKAYVGFFSPPSWPTPVAVSTGKWGCGAFNGDPELKAVIQLISASEAGRDLIFFTFGDTYLQNTLLSICDTLEGFTVGQVVRLLSQYNSVYVGTGKRQVLGIGEFLVQFANSGIPPEAQEQSPQPKKTYAQVSVQHFYSKSTTMSNVVSNFPNPN